MTISAETAIAGPYAGNGSTTAFAFNFKCFTTSDVDVYLEASSGTQSLQTLTTHYSVALNGDQDASPGGTVTMVTAPVTGESLHVVSGLPYTRTDVFSNAGGFYPNVLNDARDKTTLQIIQLKDKLSRTVMLPIGETFSSTLPSAANRADKYLAFDTNGNLQVLSGTSSSGSAVDDDFIIVDTLSELQNLTGHDNDDIVMMVGRASVSDGAGGTFRFVTGDQSTAVGDDEVTSSEGDGGIWIAPASDKTGASGAWKRIFNGALNVKWYGATGDGTTNDRAAFLAAVPAAYNSALYIPTGTYYAPNSNLWLLTSPIRIFGDGMGLTVMKFKYGSAGVAAYPIKMNSSGITLENMTFEIESDNASSTVMSFGVDSDRHRLTNIEVDGSASLSGGVNLCHAMTISNTVSVNDVVIMGCEIHDVDFGLFTQNTYTGTSSEWSFIACNFYNNTADDIELNTTNRTTLNWHEVSVIGCHFKDNAASVDPSFAFGADSGQKITITGNTFEGYNAPSAVHIEDMCNDVTVTSNIFTNCDRGVEIYNNTNHFVLVANNVFDGGDANSETIDPTTLSSPNVTLLNNSIAIISQRPTSGTNKNCRIENNIINNYDIAIASPEGRSCVIKNNTASLCKCAFVFGEAGEYGFESNLAHRCKFAIWALNADVFLDSIELDETPNMVFTAPGDVIISKGIKYSSSEDTLAATANTQCDMFEMPLYYWVTGCTAYVYDTASIGNNAVAHFDSDYNGTTVSATRNFHHAISSLTISANTLVDNSGELAFQAYNGAGSTVDVKYKVELHGIFRF